MNADDSSEPCALRMFRHQSNSLSAPPICREHCSRDRLGANFPVECHHPNETCAMMRTARTMNSREYTHAAGLLFRINSDGPSRGGIPVTHCPWSWSSPREGEFRDVDERRPFRTMEDDDDGGEETVRPHRSFGRNGTSHAEHTA